VGGHHTRGIITPGRAVHHRLDQFVIGRAEIMPITGQYTQIGGGDGWMFAEVEDVLAKRRSGDGRFRPAKG